MDQNGYTPESSDMEQQRLEALAERRRKRAEERKRRILRQRLILGGALVVLILIIVLIARSCSGSEATVNPSDAPGAGLMLPTPDPGDTDVINANSGDDEEEPVSNVTTFTLAAVGDIMSYEDQLTDALDSATGTYDFSHCLTQISRYTSAADVSIGTLETTFSGSEVGYQGRPDFNAPESMASDLAEAGFDILSTACTYSLQHGVAGLISTIRNIREAGMNNVGTYYTAEDRSSSGGVLVREVNGLKVGFLAYTKGCNGLSMPEGYEYCVNVLYEDYSTYFAEINETQIVADLTAAKALECDVLIAVLHWGSEYETTPGDDQNAIADLMFRNGVDVILGSHPHFLQPYEQRTVTTVDGEEKQVFVAYSLGNFLSSMSRDSSNDSMILNLTVAVDNETGAVSFPDINYVPIYLSPQANRFVIYDSNQAIADFNAGSSTIGDDLYASIRQSLESVHTLVGAEGDIANSVVYNATPIISGTLPDTSSTTPETVPETSLEVSPEVSTEPNSESSVAPTVEVVNSPAA